MLFVVYQIRFIPPLMHIPLEHGVMRPYMTGAVIYQYSLFSKCKNRSNPGCLSQDSSSPNPFALFEGSTYPGLS